MFLKVGDILKNNIGKMVVTAISGKWITLNTITKDNKPSNFEKIYTNQQLKKYQYKKDVLCRRVNLTSLYSSIQK